jgi:hypothetical protein
MPRGKPSGNGSSYGPAKDYAGHHYPLTGNDGGTGINRPASDNSDLWPGGFYMRSVVDGASVLIVRKEGGSGREVLVADDDSRWYVSGAGVGRVEPVE